MINLRYHIVSIVAVFLALGIGVALGSSFVDGFVVETLRRNVDSLEADRDNLRSDVDLLQNELDATREAHNAELDTLLPLSISERLSGRPVMIIATQGVDSAEWEQVRDTVIDASATYEGTLWLSDRLDLSQESNRADIAEVLGLVTDRESVVRPALFLRLARAMFPGPTSDIEVADNPLVLLRDAALLSFDNEQARTGALGEVPIPGTFYVIVGGEDAVLTPEQFVVPLLTKAVDEQLDPWAVAVQARPSDSDVSRDSYVGVLRADPLLAQTVATVDSVDTFDGVLSLVLLAERREVAHLGVAASAVDGRLPEP
ncbi:MAG: copper transporter [Acidimicrobiales bacterium]|nr:copper transporter [Acidimicrobiales bacterium]